MKNNLKQTIESLKPGDLICVEWCDASTGKSSQNGGMIDVPVRSWGVFLGLIGARVKHIILAQNSFCFTDSFFDLDYTAVPAGWIFEVQCIQAGHVPKEVADNLVRSFVRSSSQQGTVGLRRTRMVQHRMQRLSNHGRPD